MRYKLSGGTPYYFLIDNNPVINKIQGFSKFKSGWHYNEGVEFSDKILNSAIDLSNYLYDNLFLKLNAFPGLDGEILIKSYFPKTSIEITIDNNLSSNFRIETREGEELFQSGEMPIAELKKQILSHRQSYFSEWNLLESSPLIITTPKTKDLQVLRSKIRQNPLGAAYPLSAQSAQLKNQKEFANIFETGTLSTPILQYTGNSTLIYYQPALD